MKLHLIGICGTGMGALAGLLKEAGHEVHGSDDAMYPPMSEQLRALDVPLYTGFRAENLDWGPDKVVVGNVCRRDHVEVLAAQARNLPLTSFPAVLEETFLAQRHSIVVAGTHGKTTTTSLLAFTMVDAGRDPGFLVGGVPQNFGRGYRVGGGTDFVVEGDEYDSAFFDKGSKFFHYHPRTVALTSVEMDHADIFPSYEAVEAAFVKFVQLIPEDGLLVVAASSQGALDVAKAARCRVETYAVGDRGKPPAENPTWRALVEESAKGTRTAFTVTRHGETVGRFDVGLSGDHNLENALAVVALATARGLSVEEIERGLRRFAGVKRRQELRGVAAGVRVIDDYAHHPTAVHETLVGLRKRVGRGKLVAIYEPRSATSRRNTFQEEFSEAFAAADEVVVAKLYAPEGIPPEQRFDPEKLASDLRGRGTAARMIPDIDGIVAHIVERVQPGDTVVIFSTGGFGGLHEKLLNALGNPVMAARADDMRRVREILDKAGLRTKDLTDARAHDVLVVRDEGEIVGCVALEMYDDAAVLRSLAMVPEMRGHGLGWLLAEHGVQRAREQGARRLYLFTEHATDFFAEKLGFRRVDRATVEPAVAASSQFRDSTHGFVAMRLDL